MSFSRTLIVRVAVIAALVALIAYLPNLPLGDWLTDLSDWALQNPAKGAIAYLVACAFAGVLMTPGWVPMTLAGFLFGLTKGFGLAAIGMTIGGATGFVVGRSLLREWIARRIEGNRRLMAIDKALDDKAFTVVVLTRLALVLPYNVLNYVYGVTRVRPVTYVVATGVGMLPAVLMYVYFGTLARDIGQILAGGGAPPAGRWWIAGIALAAIIAATVVIHRAANRALEAETADDDPGQQQH